MSNTGLYTINKSKFEIISEENSSISNLDFYTLQLRIGVSEYVKFLNSNNVNAIRTDKESFAKNVNGIWQPNNSLVLKCIKRAETHKEYRQIDFFKSNIVLDKLKVKLKDS